MKARESGMPKEKSWSSFFAPAKILEKFGVNEGIVDVADFGCGYGTFTLAAASIIKGKIFALDIDPKMIEVVKRKARKQKLTNIEPILRDFVLQGSGLRDLTVDFVLLFNILHLDNPVSLLKETYRILKPKGKLGVIHWNYDPTTPRGPPMDIRPKPEQIVQWAQTAGFVCSLQFDLKPYHYGLLFSKDKD
jgi:ubiquinone/menaquinone biosynthesis C-methylase UbiE